MLLNLVYGKLQRSATGVFDAVEPQEVPATPQYMAVCVRF